jgi:hypothetical protein
MLSSALTRRARARSGLSYNWSRADDLDAVEFIIDGNGISQHGAAASAPVQKSVPDAERTRRLRFVRMRLAVAS